MLPHDIQNMRRRNRNLQMYAPYGLGAARQAIRHGPRILGGYLVNRGIKYIWNRPYKYKHTKPIRRKTRKWQPRIFYNPRAIGWRKKYRKPRRSYRRWRRYKTRYKYRKKFYY